jgi:hypothetical protein
MTEEYIKLGHYLLLQHNLQLSIIIIQSLDAIQSSTAKLHESHIHKHRRDTEQLILLVIILEPTVHIGHEPPVLTLWRREKNLALSEIEPRPFSS